MASNGKVLINLGTGMEDGELWLCPICVSSRELGDAGSIPHAEIVGATPMWEWAGDDTTVFSY
jgi:hypothetical protein